MDHPGPSFFHMWANRNVETRTSRDKYMVRIHTQISPTSKFGKKTSGVLEKTAKVYDSTRSTCMVGFQGHRYHKLPKTRRAQEGGTRNKKFEPRPLAGRLQSASE